MIFCFYCDNKIAELTVVYFSPVFKWHPVSHLSRTFDSRVSKRSFCIRFFFLNKLCHIMYRVWYTFQRYCFYRRLPKPRVQYINTNANVLYTTGACCRPGPRQFRPPPAVQTRSVHSPGAYAPSVRHEGGLPLQAWVVLVFLPWWGRRLCLLATPLGGVSVTCAAR